MHFPLEGSSMIPNLVLKKTLLITQFHRNIFQFRLNTALAMTGTVAKHMDQSHERLKHTNNPSNFIFRTQ